MPLRKSASIKSNIKEFAKGKTFARTKKKFGAKKAVKQAVAVAYATKRKSAKKKKR